MNKIIAWLEAAKQHLEKDYDMIVPVIGDEGMGKSTLIMELAWLWQPICDNEQTIENAMNTIAWDRNQFKTYISSKEQYSMIVVHDAARVLSKKKAMHGAEIELEEDLLDMRFGNYLVLLGFQEFDLLPTMLATRRAKQLLRIPERGIVHGLNESGIRKRYNDDKWPKPVLRDSFPSLEGKHLWDAFESEDQRRKQARIKPDENEEQDEKSLKEWAEQAQEDGIEKFVSVHGGNQTLYIDKALIEAEYGLSGNKSRKIASLLKRKVANGEISFDGDLL